MIPRALECLLLVATSVVSPAVDPVAETIRQRLEAAGQPAVLHIDGELVHASTP